MTHTVITFLGIRPQQTTYRYDGREYQGQVFAEAILQFLNFDRMLVLTTPEAESVYSSTLEKGNDPRIQKVPIPTGRDDKEMWGIFDNVIDEIKDGEEVTFDITHGLRSIPFLAFLFAAYLKSAKGVTIRSILYGALDLQKENNGVAPVLDLSRFASMLDWINAADQFVQTGNATRLADLLGGVKEQKRAAETLRTVSQAAFLCQPVSLMKASTDLRPHLERAARSFSHTSRPFSVLSKNIIGIFDDFALEAPLDDPLEFIRREWKMIEWYADHGQMLQAVTLAREVMIDAVAVRYEKNIHLKHDQRSTLEKAISGIAKIGQPITDEHTGEKRKFSVDDLNRIGYQIYNEWPDAESMAKNFSSLTRLRNQLSHAEHQADRMNLPKVERQISEVLDALHQLLIKWQILPADENPPADLPTPSD
ncbi:CRISPR-associated protein, TM1812 family [Bellilinea caldifistulae]|uniref:TIGR02221 family CRISPR-associated protein n=1 Tax=Bellilinea caldifistulae TaxID=360411 RepID=UPI00078577DF|nr:TIGR02221 family CRISPR-associated protein [Bellilinea caldifistulae]GAP11880.1 CRISPR-associated protein, TM1812 family [Bellilinea caldifistulae]